jgi:molybdate transport system ATP-binding protein
VPSPFVELESVSVQLQGKVVFSDASWVIRTGEQWAIVGPNGSGKSVLAAAICSQVPIVHGRVLYHFLSGDEARDACYGYFKHGSVVRVSADDHRLFAEQFSGYHQSRWHASEGRNGATVADLLSRQAIEAVHPFQVLEGEADHERIAAFDARRRETIAAFGLGALLQRGVRQLSSGELRKVVLARAVMRDPRLLVLDEPFAGLDEKARAALRKTLDELALGGVQLVVVVSRRDELPSCVDHTLVLEDHRIVSRIDRRAEPRQEAADGCAAASPNAAGAAPCFELGEAEPLIVLRDISIRYGDAVILDSVNLTVRRGQHWAVLGPNGAGKTTLLSLVLADHPQAYANDVELFGRRRGTGESIWDIKARVGWVSSEIHAHYPEQEQAIDVVCSGLFASIGLHADCTERQLDRARACLDRFAPFAVGRTLGELSYGEQRLVLIARALVGDPDVLALDEPCEGLDASSRHRVLDAVQGIAREGKASILFVTHRFDEIPSCISHVLELGAGRVVRAGPL